MKKLLTCAAALLTALGITFVAPTTANASAIFVYGPADASSFTWSCFGYSGTFRSDYYYPTVLDFSTGWPDGSYGCYGISPGRHIYQINSTASGWSEIPGGGVADYVYGYWNDHAGVRRICVGRLDTGRIYFDTYYAGSGWAGWYTGDSSSCPDHI